MFQTGGRNLYYYQPIYRKPPDTTHRKSEIKVTGEGRISIQPDTAQVLIGVETENTELRTAQAENAQKISDITHALIDIGILTENIQTDNFTIFPMYDFVDGKQVFRGYRIDHMLQVTVLDIDKVGLVVDTAVEHGANRVSNISFQILNSSNLYQRALTMAVEDALQKAKTIANAFNLTLIPTPKSVVEERRFLETPIPLQKTQMVLSASTEIQPGKEDIEAVVTAVFSTMAG